MGGIEWSVLGSVVAAIVAIGGVIVRLVDRINKADAKADAAERQAVALSASLSVARLELQSLEADLVDHRVAVAKEYVSKDTLASLETRIVEAINRLGDRLDKMLTR